MVVELIDDETLDTIPDGDPAYAFSIFERECRKSAHEAIDATNASSEILDTQMNYILDVVAAAQHYGIADIKDYKIPTAKSMNWEVYNDFCRRVRFFTTHFRLNAKANRKHYSVQLQPSNRERIRTLLSHLKAELDKAEMEVWRKSRLQKRILDFEKALDEKRLRFAESMMALSLIGAAVASLGNGAEGLGKLVHEITIAIGQSKEIEDDNTQLPPTLPYTVPLYITDRTVAKDDPDTSKEMPF